MVTRIKNQKGNLKNKNYKKFCHMQVSAKFPCKKNCTVYPGTNKDLIKYAHIPVTGQTRNILSKNKERTYPSLADKHTK